MALLSSADFWRFAAESVLADIAADLVGPDVKFHSLRPILPGTKTVGHALSSENVSNRTINGSLCSPTRTGRL
jgi:hypothetical protein